tara:strand:+ start:2452 stop:3429 length:978 start_codon:yes stop_codon:yes gene_type:complete
MKVGIVTANVNVVGGVQIFTRDLEKLLSDRGHQVDVVGLDTTPENKDAKLPEASVGNHFNTLNEKENYDVVICNGEFGYSVDHPKAINVFHGNYLGYANAVSHLVPQETTDRRLAKVPIQKASSEGKYVVSVSNFASRGLTESGIEVDQVIPLSVNTNLFYPEESKINASSLALSRGRMYEKGFDILERLAKAGVPLRVFSDYPINLPNVDSQDFKDNESLGAEYNQANLFLNPSRFEGGGITTLEAMACACPVITTPTGYGVDIKKEIPEFVVDKVDDISEFQERIETITNNRKAYGRKARSYFFDHHHPKAFKKAWISLVENL